MRGCQTVQCLVPKPEGWTPALDDEDFEKDCSHFLSGIHTGMWGEPGFVSPVRRGVTSISHDCPVLNGHVPVQKLIDFLWIRDTRAFRPLCEHFSELPRTWLYRPGEEWMATSPFYVLRLRDLLERAMDVHPSFTPHHGAFQRESFRGSSDLFPRLPPEIRHLILEHLPALEIASLRLASRTIHQLPGSLFYRLLRQDMPWLWEIYNDDPHYFWATVTEQDFRDHEVEGINVDNTPHRNGGTVRLVTSHSIDVKKHLEKWTYPKPPRYRTNWFLLYNGIKREWNELKGLRNRKRIWEFQTRLFDPLDLYSDDD
ncbi:hypothetical protein BDW74DRAFT_182183 [Aspergillus multicolor]|uniref:uncharacterized protein n=1 Tax=Aspergillus multicolor TaxID=41759 RepID=UPI003CCE3667